jgi:hypothetical protein
MSSFAAEEYLDTKDFESEDIDVLSIYKSHNLVQSTSEKTFIWNELAEGENISFQSLSESLKKYDVVASDFHVGHMIRLESSTGVLSTTQFNRILDRIAQNS